MFFKTIFDNANLLERLENARILESGTEISEGNVKKVFEGIRPEIVKYAEHDSDRFDVYQDIHGSTKVVNTWLHEEDELDVIKQDVVPDTYFDAVINHGLEHVIKETVEIEESFLENGYIYRDLKPDNIRFHEGTGMAIDYLDRLAVQTIEEVEDVETALAKSYDLFLRELDNVVYGLDTIEAEKLIDKHSSYTEAWAFTGEPYIDFEYTGGLSSQKH